MDKHKQASPAAQASRLTDKESKSQPVAPPNGHPFVWFLGASAVAGGCALVLLPIVARDLSWITNSFSKNGISGAALVLTGVVLIALATVSRKRTDTSQSRQIADQGVLLQQLASDLALTRGGMQELRVEFVYLKDHVNTAIAQRELLDSQSEDSDGQAALFRLAASMDQLTGRLEMRMKTQDAALSDQLALVRDELTQSTANLAGLRVCIEGALNATLPHEGNADAEYHHSDEPQIEIDEGFEPHEDDLEVTVELDEAEETSLGLLDDMDDEGRPLPAKQSPSNRPSRRSTDLDALAGLLPSRTGVNDMGIDEKLSTLRALMSDPNVRQALEASRRS